MKKFLSLVLALIMTMSLVTISAGATEYRDLTDKDEIQYEEAVAVLNRIGVITGYEDGSFRPEGELTRGAAAKIIVSLLIGPEAASNLPNATAPYPDVPASHTFAGVISYCKTAKIISGYGDGTFKPGNSLTGFAFAKMLLGALGYKQEIEGFVDTGWTMNVAKVGNVTGLFDRLDFDGAAAVNRETACQLALNTLKATMVTYGGTTMVSGAQTLAVQGTQAMYVTSNNREINANINRRYINATNNEMTLEFGEEHFKDLRLEHDKYDPAYDDFGHPSNEWSYKKVTIGTFKLPADFTYTKQMAHREDTAATKEKALDLRNYDTFSTDHLSYTANWSTASSNNNWNSPFACATQITINGWNARALNADYKQGTIPSGTKNGNLFDYDAFDVKTSNKEQAPSLAEICDLTDNGVTVEVYVCPVDADFITNVVVTRTQLMKVKRLGSDYVTLERISPDSHDPRGDGDIKAITGYNAFAVDVDVEDVKDNNYDPYNVLKDLKAGDYVAVVPFTPDEGKTYEVGEVYVPETVSGRLSDVSLYMNTNRPEGNAVSVTIGGTKYVINEWNLDMLNVKKAQINATRKDVTGYLAKDGTVLWTTEIGNSDAWMIVGEYYQATSSSGKVAWWVKGWTLGGEQVELDLGTIRNEAERYAPGELVHYILADGGTGEYVLEKPNYKDTATGANQKSFWYSHSQDTNDNQWFSERALTKVVKNQTEFSGEGIYNVAQYVKGSDGENKPYTIHPANSLIPLEDYYNYNQLTKDGSAVGGAIFSDEDKNTNPHEWDYTHVTYKDKGVKFIYVSIAPGTGNVDYISVRSDAQSVSNEELAGQNKAWNNVATHGAIEGDRDWVISPAEAYVNEDGNVEAVVIKAEPAVADLSNVVIITKVDGVAYGKNTGADEVSVSNANRYEYVQGPNFNETKTGTFKHDHKVGDILVIRNTVDEVMDCKTINDGVYDNRNPDAFKAVGVTALTNTQDKESKIAFYVGKGAKHTVNELGRTGAALTEANDTIMTNKKAEGEFDELATDYKGLIKVSTTKWLDLRATQVGGPIEGLGDLLDYDRDSIDIRVLVNGKENSDNFRRAYAIVVMNAVNKKDDANAPSINISALKPNDNGFYNTAVLPTSGDGTTQDKALVFKAPANSLLKLTANYSVTGVAENAKWTVVSGTASINGNEATVTVPNSTDIKNAAVLRFAVTNHDNTVKDNPLTTKTVWVKVVAEEGKDEPTVEGTKTGEITTKLGYKIKWTAMPDGAGAVVKAELVGGWPKFVSTDNTTIGGSANDATITGKLAGSKMGLEVGATTFTFTPDTTTVTVQLTSYKPTTAAEIDIIEAAGTNEADLFHPSNVIVEYDTTAIGVDVAPTALAIVPWAGNAAADIPLSTENTSTAVIATVDKNTLRDTTITSKPVTSRPAADLTAEIADPSTGKATGPANLFAANAIKPAGTSAVKIALAKKNASDTLDVSYPVTPSGAKNIKDCGDAANTTGTISLTVSPTGPFTKGGKAQLQAEVSALGTGNGGYQVSVTLPGETSAIVGYVTAATTPTNIGDVITVNGPIDLRNATIAVTPIKAVTSDVTVSTANAAKSVITFNFTSNVKLKDGFDKTDVNDVVTDDTGVSIIDVTASGTTVTVTLSGALTATKVVTLKAGSVVDASYGKVSNTSDVTHTGT